MFFAQAGIAAGLCVFACVPWSDSFSKADIPYYLVKINETVVGHTSSKEEAQKAYTQARQRLGAESSSVVYLDAEVALSKDDAIAGKYTESGKLAENIYQQLKKEVLDIKEQGYELKVNETSVMLASLEEVTQVMNQLEDAYDVDNEYQSVIVQKDEEHFSNASAGLVKMSIEPENKPIVMAYEEMLQVQTEENSKTTSISFGDEIEIIQTRYADGQAVSVEEAVAALKPVLSVVVKNTEVYTESLPYETEYIYNEDKYDNYSEVVQQGVEGSQEITAEVVYENGVETGRTVLSTNVVTEAVAEIIEVGTQERPDFIIPLKRPRISSYYGARWGTVHKGIDFACSTGTNILASASGTVVEATYRWDFGYTIVINHGNGIKTRYAHMSKLLAENGDYVNQGDVIGLSGNTGDSTGPHLHFEFIKNGDRIDPYPYIYE